MGRALASVALTSPMGRADTVGRTALAAARALPPTAPPEVPVDWTSSRVPHSRHSRHWPIHLGLDQPHSVQW